MNAIFISYRRADIPSALLVYNQRGKQFGTDRVFPEIEDIAPGQDFVARIHGVLDDPSDLETLVAALKREVGPAGRGKAVAAAPTRALTNAVSDLQLRAIGLIEHAEVAAAQRTLNAGWEMLMAARAQHEPDARFQLQLGYLHETIAQAFDAAGKPAEADRYMALAASSFAHMEHEG